MKFLIIGGTQFIGPHVVNLLQSKGHEVILFHRKKSMGSLPTGVSEIQGDRSNLPQYRKLFKSLSPNAVIDMIPYSEKDAQLLVEAFRGVVKRIVVISSCEVYQAYDRLCHVVEGPLIPTPLNENAELRTHFWPKRKEATGPNDWKYDYDKILVEKVLFASPDICSTILRLPIVYGTGDYSRIYPYLKRMTENRSILLNKEKATNHFCRGYVEDVAHAIVLAALDERLGNYIYNIAEPNAYSETEWIEHIAKVAACKNSILLLEEDELPEHLKAPLCWQQDLTLDSSKIRSELGYSESFTSDVAMSKTITWLQKNPLKNRKEDETQLTEENKAIKRHIAKL
jgi:nucleoside-diphosphate-sugar epimerase